MLFRCGVLFCELGRAGLWVETALEAYPSDKIYIPLLDLDKVEIREQLRWEIRSGYIRYLHFGLPCKGWGPANRLNGGTRSAQFPDGASECLPRESLANFQGNYVCELCAELDAVGGFFTIENPWSSDVWRSSPFSRLRDVVNIFLIPLDQCAFGHQLPKASQFAFCMKATGLAANFPEIKEMSIRCPGLSAFHPHDVAWGSRKVSGTCLSLAKAAGRYPRKLCAALARVMRIKIAASSHPTAFLGVRPHGAGSRDPA